MELQVTEQDGVTRVALKGRLDTAGMSAVELGFTASIVPKAQPTIVDMSEVSFMASLGVRMFISTARALSRAGGKMALFGANSSVMEIIEVTRLNDIIPYAQTEAEALELVKG